MKINTQNFDLKIGINGKGDISRIDPLSLRVKKRVQKMGSFMAGMIMPSISILIAWGLLAAAFLGKYENKVWVATGWFNWEPLGQFITPGMKYLIPIIIGYTVGFMIYSTRGGIFGAFITLMIIVGSDWLYSKGVISNWKIGGSLAKEVGAPNQIIGAMVVVPISTFIYKRIEITYINNIKSGFEMLVRNFSLAIWCIVFGLVFFWVWGFILYGITYVMTFIIELFTDFPATFPFMSIITEPLRAAFLNNALNHGVMAPLGHLEVEAKGFSAFFMVGGNPGQGLGLLMAYVIWRKKQRGAASGSSLIQLFGGIHEVHYVYILSEPIMILATIAGGFTSLGILALFNGGAIATISPGSIISVVSMSGSAHRILINILAVFIGALVSFGVASIIMIFKKESKTENTEVSVTDEGISFKKSKSNQNIDNNSSTFFDWEKTKLLMVACDAGVGSSAMAASIIKKFVKDNKINIEVSNCAVKDLKTDVDIVVTMKQFADLAKDNSPNAKIYPVRHFLGKDVFAQLEKDLKKYKSIDEKENKNE